MFEKPTRWIVIVAATLALAACQQQSKQSEQAPAAMQPAPMSTPTNETNTSSTNTTEAQNGMTAEPESTGPAMTAEPTPSTAMKPATTEPTSESTTMTATTEAKPSAAPAPAPEPVPSAAMTAEPAAPAPKPAAAPAESFNTTKCKACHAIDKDKVGPAWKTVVEKYGDAATLAKDFESGFKERRVANSIAKWKSKEVLMTSQYRSLIKGHEKAVAHALFETVKQGKFGNY